MSFLDMRTIYNRELLDSFVSVAEKYNIPYQFKKGRTGGNDAGIIHLSCGGVKTMTLSVPTKYIHSPSSVIKISDYMAMKELVTKYLEEVAL